MQVPIVLVTLVEEDKHWSLNGLSVTNTARTLSFAAWTLLPDNPEVGAENTLHRFHAQCAILDGTRHWLIQNQTLLSQWAHCPARVQANYTVLHIVPLQISYGSDSRFARLNIVSLVPFCLTVSLSLKVCFACRLQVLEVIDAREHPWFKDNALVTGPPYLVGYTGVPLVSPKDGVRYAAPIQLHCFNESQVL